MRLLETLERLVMAHGPPGREDEVRDLIIGEVRELVDELMVDRMGNLIAVKHGSGGPKVMLDAHMDEVGIVVKHIDKNGWVRFDRQGGVNEMILQGQRVTLLTRSGPVQGVVGVKSRHLTSEEELARRLPVGEMWIDIGASSRDEAAELGVEIGDLGTYEKRFHRLGGKDLVCATSLDDRAGCLVLLETFRMLEDAEATVHAVFTVQEETGCRGAKTAAFRIDPDIAFVVDTTYGEDPVTKPTETSLKIGGGPSVRAMERSRWGSGGHTVPRRIFDFIVDTAEEAGIPYQKEVTTMAVTDASTLHLAREGIPTGEILVARRYSHSPIEVASMADIEDASRLLSAVVSRIDTEWVGGLEKRIK